MASQSVSKLTSLEKKMTINSPYSGKIGGTKTHKFALSYRQLSRQGPAVIILNELNDHYQTAIQLASHFKVFIIDLLGFGNSDKPGNYGASFNKKIAKREKMIFSNQPLDRVNDVFYLANFCRTVIPKEKVILISDGWTCALSFHLAAKLPFVVKGIISIDNPSMVSNFKIRKCSRIDKAGAEYWRPDTEKGIKYSAISCPVSFLFLGDRSGEAIAYYLKSRVSIHYLSDEQVIPITVENCLLSIFGAKQIVKERYPDLPKETQLTMPSIDVSSHYYKQLSPRVLNQRSAELSLSIVPRATSEPSSG